jgi:hypothetical protein
MYPVTYEASLMTEDYPPFSLEASSTAGPPPAAEPPSVPPDAVTS